MEIKNDEASQEPGETSGKDAAAAGQEPEYPPETYRWMSWSAIKFIHRPSLKALAWTCYFLMFVLAAGFVATFFIRLDIRVEAPGEITADLGVLQTVTQIDGLMGAPLVPVGATVAKGDVLGFLQMDMEAERITGIVAALDNNLALVDAVGRNTQLSEAVESGASLYGFRDDAVREAAAALNTAVRRLQQSLARREPFEEHKAEVIRQSRQLKGLVVRYLEQHQLCAPAAGMVLQYEVSTNGNVRASEPVATILQQGSKLIARIPLEANDMPDIAVGQKVRHKVAAYPFQRYGLFEGEILSIERSQQNKGILSYEIRASLRNPARLSERLGKNVHLVMGMKLNSQIITGNRAVSDILLDSLFQRR